MNREEFLSEMPTILKKYQKYENRVTMFGLIFPLFIYINLLSKVFPKYGFNVYWSYIISSIIIFLYVVMSFSIFFTVYLYMALRTSGKYQKSFFCFLRHCKSKILPSNGRKKIFIEMLKVNSSSSKNIIYMILSFGSIFILSDKLLCPIIRQHVPINSITAFIGVTGPIGIALIIFLESVFETIGLSNKVYPRFFMRLPLEYTMKIEINNGNIDLMMKKKYFNERKFIFLASISCVTSFSIINIFAKDIMNKYITNNILLNIVYFQSLFLFGLIFFAALLFLASPLGKEKDTLK